MPLTYSITRGKSQRQTRMLRAWGLKTGEGGPGLPCPGKPCLVLFLEICLSFLIRKTPGEHQEVKYLFVEKKPDLSNVLPWCGGESLSKAARIASGWVRMGLPTPAPSWSCTIPAHPATQGLRLAPQHDSQSLGSQLQPLLFQKGSMNVSLYKKLRHETSWPRKVITLKNTGVE